MQSMLGASGRTRRAFEARLRGSLVLGGNAGGNHDLLLLRLSGGNGRGRSSMALLSGAEHESLVDVTEVGGLGLGLLEPRLQLCLGHLEVTNVGGG